MGKVKDLTGMVFGRLTAIRQDGYYINPKGKSHGAKWMCECSCGNTTSVAAGSLKNGSTQSCGCLNRETYIQHLREVQHLSRASRVLPDGEASLNSLYTGYKYGARKRGYSFSITKDSFRHLTKQDCYYCGAPPFAVHINNKTANGSYTYTGIDRIDNGIGYVDGNVVPCCKDCNLAKGTKTQDQFFELVRNIYTKHLYK